jgi:hypothetical protein
MFNYKLTLFSRERGSVRAECDVEHNIPFLKKFKVLRGDVEVYLHVHQSFPFFCLIFMYLKRDELEKVVWGKKYQEDCWLYI